MLIRHAARRRNVSAHQLLTFNSSRLLSSCCTIHSRSLGGSSGLLTTRQDLRPWRRKAFWVLLGTRLERNLATALDDFKAMDDIPFEDLPSSLSSNYPSLPEPPRFYELRPFDASLPLVVKEPAPKARRQKINPSGIPGDVEEMLSIFDACLQVGKVDRAELVLKRFNNMKALAGRDLIELHNRYLHARLGQILASPNLDRAENLHKWYELQIRSQNLPQTAETIAYMVKASLLTAHGLRLERLIDRYMGMVPGDAGLEVLYMGDILTDQDLATITQICSTYNLAPGDFPSSLTPNELATGPGQQLTETRAQSTGAVRAPEVLSTPQTGMGLKMLKQSLTLFSEIPPGHDISELPYAERREIQSRLERDAVASAVERWRSENQALRKMGLNTSLSVASLNSRLYDWQCALEARLAKELVQIEMSEAVEQKSKEDLDRCMYGPFIRQSTPSRLAAVTILSTLSSLAMHGADKGVPLGIVINQLSKVVEEDIRAQQRAKEHGSVGGKNKRPRRLSKHEAEQRNADGATGSREAEVGNTSEKAPSNVMELATYDQYWPLAIRTKVGAALLSALIQTAKVNVIKEHPETKQFIAQFQPAFSHANQFKKGKKVGMILPNRTLVELLKREPKGQFLARHLPMVVEPEPWSKFDKGGFLESPVPLVRVKLGEKDQRIYTEAAIARGDMEQVFKGLDVLGKTAWRINQPVFNVMLEAWNTGEAIADFPPLNPNIPIPPEPESSEDPLQRSMWIRSVKAAENEKTGLHSLRCFNNFQLEIARAFRDQTFYFPHNVDFRGRAYPIPTYLNHMGADHVRGLMCFAKGKELGENGLRWLKIHLANVFGYDKASLRDRESFVMDNMENIFDSATNPLGGSRWWLKAEDPWQCLATCFELKVALESPDPTKVVSHLPVHQDGTCNGLQHYAALGGDTWGAKQVNLEPGDKPADVYAAVAELVKQGIAHDLEQGNPFAKALDGKVTRKVVKQTVMTNVYGVTFAGAKKQVLKQLNALYPDLEKKSGINVRLLASYIATKIFNALSSMFRGAHDIQYWLGEIGSRVCRALTSEQLDRIATELPTEKKTRGLKSKTKKTSTDELLSQFRSTLVWTTPLRMPVVQPYRKSGTRVISTCLQDLILSTPERSDPVHRRKQLQAFPPNFIHSLDASHMILSALECDERGLTFAAVHDSFWTHATDVDTMNGVIRDAFIRIHTEDVIARLAAEFKARYRGSIYLAKVNKGSKVEKKITAFRKKKNVHLKDELLLEKKRLDLLASTDPSDVAKGKKMVTPASIFEEMSAADALAETDNMAEFALGNIPDQEQESSTAPEDAVTAAEDEEHGEDIEASQSEAELHDDEEGHAPEDRLQSLMGTNHFELKITASPAPRVKEKQTIHLWLPLTFPDIPKKGDFDVRRLKASEYFFS